MRLYCDMDMVLVHQTASHGFDAMPWMQGGKELWQFIKPFRPTLLTQVRESRFGDNCLEKLRWIQRELGNGVPVIFAPDSVGKGPYARAGDILIDDADKHCQDWHLAGGKFVMHRSADLTIATLKRMV